ncbi:MULTISPECIES: hypothetical protein [unclassified Thermosynechococcus]|uniref:hypothetical protein n=1 Tax=unclassified Thermosynechococcus TaxID=2622553 RepID=UPI00197D2DBE|nr:MULTISPECIES: hypothetical protein [unclassified Thermosynechococcus]MDR7920818.1 hypothetical protein [Thermosynechococcus sp. HY213]QSF49439.1 hypothetical protein JW907_01230 [Thermosynechococcus sp. TA-1]WNC22515.1 hypothetical protein RHG98_01220 [Thermosynechococcus sp. PP22]WNC32755.1 hypothetical protein RHH81_01240 [Thermosynechococcus sp. PKX95]WNC35283.1 hypothetical protein RHH79_01240 [Thermosynechococcus sp. PKX91]
MTQAYTPEDVWRLLGELLEAQKETERRFQETERRFQETDRRFQETERLLREEARQLNQQIGKLGNRLGEFVEWQVRPAVLRLFQSRGIAVSQLYSDVILQDGNESLEIDLLVVNTDEAVLVEVKTKLSQSDVDEHLERIAKFRRLAHQYRGTKLLGAVAGMIVPPEVARYAYRQGLFVLAQSGDGVAILNDPQFQPRAW